MARLFSPIGHGALLALLVGGCASAPPSLPPQALLISPGCRTVTRDGPPGAYVVLARVSIDIATDTDEKVIDEALAGKACGWGADAIVRDGAERLIPRPESGARVAPAPAITTEWSAPAISDSPQRIFALAIKLVR